ncbi:hypothetical protein ACD591_17890 [Rufibacter glacialis]|uniref:Class I SAM-dependent methyltransferase n=1 Tax=Rufibacter glacialis TaxID=1259555 RepID=A0A5M8Q4A8_9BACT|nr:hypothetical protein [Rufibacter glacialis]KAA6430715.1 hypothetical protein FOE74_19810 [Rufibacter glacialis]GGK86110.1 hypothetical protein GCM10011405_37370 [Rufibacter glacialis]
MKRIHLFEFEDQPWFPDWIRISLTRLIVVMHGLLGTTKDVAQLVHKILRYSPNPSIIDLCSGSGGPMVEVAETLKEDYQVKEVTLTLTDLYPNLDLADNINRQGTTALSYLTQPIDAANVPSALTGIRTMVCSFHHMKPATARRILVNAKEAKQPLCIYEISDNSFPTFLWWIALPLNFIMAFLITPFVRPLTWKQIVFTYLVPLIPVFFAWDGAVSNVRTYTLKDLDVLLEGLTSEEYQWEKGTLPGKAKKLYLLGFPTARP